MYFQAMIRIPSEVIINFCGVLWYQGENDSSLLEANALSYGGRFDDFIDHFRLLLLSLRETIRTMQRDFRLWQPCIDGVEAREILPFLTVSITTTRRKQCINRDIIRFQQLERRYRIRSGVETDQTREEDQMGILLQNIDAFGLPLKADNIHIDVPAIFHLGRRLALQYVQLRAIENNKEALSIMDMQRPYTDSDIIQHSLGPWGDVIEVACNAWS